MKVIPGTVSEILWHFTGGPAWSVMKNKQGNKPKSAGSAYRALIGILETSELKLGQYKEVVRVSIPAAARGKRGSPQSRRLATLQSAPVCCIADIPIRHLGFHAERYGKFAIGFHRSAVLRHGFNPVFYTLHGSRIMRTINEGFARADPENFSLLRDIVRDLRPSNAFLEIEEIFAEEHVEAAWKSIQAFLAFVKTFDRKEMGTIYSEREWRSVKAYRFVARDVAMVILPKRCAGSLYFDRFVDHILPGLQLPRGVPVVPWEHLVES
jgi:hypothetical protein